MNRRIIVWIVGTVVFLLALVLVLLLTASTAKAQNLQGSFSGKLNAGMAKLTIVLNIEADGTASATFSGKMQIISRKGGASPFTGD